MFNVGCAPVEREKKEKQEAEKNAKKELRTGQLSVSAELLKKENSVLSHKMNEVSSEIWRTGDTLYWKVSIDTVGVLGTAKFIGCGCDRTETDQLKLKTEVVDKIHQFAYEAKLEAKNREDVEFSLDKEVVLSFEIERTDRFPEEVWIAMWLACLIAGLFIIYLFYKIDEDSDTVVIAICIIAGFLISAVVTLGLGSVFFEMSWTSGIICESLVIGVAFIWCLTFWTQGWQKSLKQSLQRKKAAKEAKAAEALRIKKQRDEEKKNLGMTF
ncbi:hypothetical protein FACS1894176_00900 [Bacteroidia bacterium]|nr:hypothetical protein FACS1894176_00900 [Bacteroidia bacterium]